ncbi:MULTISPECIES: hypothetical protein [Bacillus cereus group]|uniref:hypothetical protein n=1 Tax=Bacillus cereus group TaxID=86661 RepID=UPI000863E12D|nr:MULTISPECIES: hypothetical protein [Bacillus cereus group]MBJ8073650.1 hypothetical protein [Bacillus cereus]MBJ8190689.1 hypothetical protein [Bacillus cereus]SCM87705.1 Uncharacterized protein BWAI21_03145 [Bacillus mycoides]
MNWTVLKDSKTMWGFAIAILFAILSIILAVKESGYWVVLVMLATILTFLSVNRANKVYKSRS